MGKPTNLVSTAHAQAAEAAALFGAQKNDAALVAENDELTAANAGLKSALDKAQGEVLELQAALDAEKAAHAETQAALDAATTTQDAQEPQQ